MSTTLSRKEYVLQQKQNHNRLSVAVLPVHYPKEILTALDILAVEMWGPPGIATGAGAARIQSYICSVARNAMSFIESGHADVVDGILFPHTCDSLQGLATLIPDWGSWQKPIFRFQHPRGPQRLEARSYLRNEVKSLISDLESAFNRKLSFEKLASALLLHEVADDLKRALWAKRRYFVPSDLELYTLLRKGEYLWIEDYIAILKEAVEGISKTEVQDGIPLLVTGYVPEPMGILKTLNDAGAFIVADDYAAIGRRIPASLPKKTQDSEPLERVVMRYLSYPPCPTRSSDTAARISYLLALARDAGARGIVIHEIKFCEPELFDVPMIRDAFEKEGLPVLFLESELENTVTAQTATRIEAFAEMMREKSSRDKSL
jgi:benzoyl-CoA reductase/2-hydroxyglutaryl-CoA dehydratase subunit BcrC/BadD/HgdB